jgi:hypothetical protein
VGGLQTWKLSKSAKIKCFLRCLEFDQNFKKNHHISIHGSIRVAKNIEGCLKSSTFTLSLFPGLAKSSCRWSPITKLTEKHQCMTGSLIYFKVTCRKPSVNQHLHWYLQILEWDPDLILGLDLCHGWKQPKDIPGFLVYPLYFLPWYQCRPWLTLPLHRNMAKWYNFH